MTHPDDMATAQEAYEMSCEALEFAKRVYREWGKGMRISTDEGGKTDAPLNARSRSCNQGGIPLTPLTLYRLKLDELRAQAKRERWGYDPSAAPEMAKLALQLFVTEARR